MTWRPYGEMTPLLKAFSKNGGGSLLAVWMLEYVYASRLQASGNLW